MAKQNPESHEQPREDFTLKETSPDISRRRVSVGPTTSFDLVEHMNFLYVKVVKARNLRANSSPCVELTIGNYRGTTQQQQNMVANPNPEWNQVFAFNKEIIQDTDVRILVKDMKPIVPPNVPPPGDDILGLLVFEIAEVPTRTPPDSSLAPQWYRLEDSKGVKFGGEMMLSLWMGTQADEAFSDAWHSDAAMVNGEGVFSTRSKVYMSPKLWYLRVNIIEAQDLIILDKNRKPNVLVKAMLGNLVLSSKVSKTKSANPMWNEDLMFVAAEPFDEPLLLRVEDRVEVPNKKDECLGRCSISLKTVHKRPDAAPGPNIWYNLERPEMVLEGEEEKVKFASKLHMRISLDGGYHVLDEPTYYTSDLRPTIKSLWKPAIGVLELGILNASGLLPMKPNENRTDAYCVAKYGHKWVRTRTIANSFAPKWNEQYTWEVFDPCTVITIGVFDNSNIRVPQEAAAAAMDSRIGKVRIRLSTLELDRTYTHSYPLVALQPSGVKKMGEIQLAVRFSCGTWWHVLQTYLRPVLPAMHYILPLSVFQLDSLRHQASFITALRLSLAEPPLRKEVVDYMLDADVNLWSTRRGKANFYRVSKLFNGLVMFMKWFDQIQKWTNPYSTVLVFCVYLIFLLYPHLILQTSLLYLTLVGVYRYRKRPRNPPHMDTELSHAYTVSLDELDEEFDSFPSRKSNEILRMRYDRLRSFAGRIQSVLGDIATQGERVESLLSWRDPRATFLFVGFCALVSVVVYLFPFRVIAFVGGLYVFRPPIWRIKIPSFPQNFLRRMPAKTDCML
ncbi:FT-interacting protein 4 [Ziziphus jujuba]|uniref:FT-interacting protein 4 n=2 Tax=Ziziphus jujuba TaxID=326968 RepID=A0A6P3Z7L8_ZIZJJ|nr:FT-interacting protein 4 [Ziziphus jujuba]KAH7544815.1 hypothetical protein FEM48_Zijuj01G0026300 [Ziziphus jujuba var. spinosa]